MLASVGLMHSYLRAEVSSDYCKIAIWLVYHLPVAIRTSLSISHLIKLNESEQEVTKGPRHASTRRRNSRPAGAIALGAALPLESPHFTQNWSKVQIWQVPPLPLPQQHVTVWHCLAQGAFLWVLSLLFWSCKTLAGSRAGSRWSLRFLQTQAVLWSLLWAHPSLENKWVNAQNITYRKRKGVGIGCVRDQVIKMGDCGRCAVIVNWFVCFVTSS